MGGGLSDYGARWYDGSVGRFTGVDPLVEKYSFQSPYAYATNNPVLFRDILGMGVENEYVRDSETGELIQVGNKGGDETDYIYSGKIHKDGNGNVTHVAYSEADAEVFSVGIVFSPDLAIGSEWSTERVPGAIIQHTSGSDAIQPVDDPFTMMAPGVMKYLGAKMLAYSVEKAAAKATGQAHHLLGTKITRALNSHPTLKGAFDYSRTNSKYIYNALDDAAHKGYQTWHRRYDATVVKWLQNNPTANEAQFNKYLNNLHQQPWLKSRIPNVNIK